MDSSITYLFPFDSSFLSFSCHNKHVQYNPSNYSVDEFTAANNRELTSFLFHILFHLATLLVFL